jgi:hypothetical protein
MDVCCSSAPTSSRRKKLCSCGLVAQPAFFSFGLVAIGTFAIGQVAIGEVFAFGLHVGIGSSHFSFPRFLPYSLYLVSKSHGLIVTAPIAFGGNVAIGAFTAAGPSTGAPTPLHLYFSHSPLFHIMY